MILVPTYLFAAALATAMIDVGGPGWLNLVVLTCICYADVVVMPTLRPDPRSGAVSRS